MVGHDADRVAVQPREAGDPRSPVVRPHLEEAAAIQHGVEDLARLVDAPAFPGHGGEQRLVAALRVVRRFGHRRCRVDVRRQIGEEAPHLGKRIGFVFRQIHDDAVLHLNALVAKLLLGDGLPGRLLDHLRAGDEHLAGAPHHDVEVAQARLHRRQASHRAEHRGDHRDVLHELGGKAGAGVAGQIGAPHLLEGAHAAAGGVEQPHVGDARFEGEALGEAALVADRGIGGAAANREVAAGERHLASVDVYRPRHGIGGLQAGHGIAVPACRAGDGADFVERAGVFEQRDPFPNGQPPPRMVEGDALRTAHFLREGHLLLELADFLLPAHPGSCLLFPGSAGWREAILPRPVRALVQRRCRMLDAAPKPRVRRCIRCNPTRR